MMWDAFMDVMGVLAALLFGGIIGTVIFVAINQPDDDWDVPERPDR